MKENYVQICHELGWVVAEDGDRVVLLKQNDDGTNYAVRGKIKTLIGGVDFGITPRQIEKLTEVKNGTVNEVETKKAAKDIARLLQELSLEAARELISDMSLNPAEPIMPETTQHLESDRLQQTAVEQKPQLQQASNNEYSADWGSTSKQASERPGKSARRETAKEQPEDNIWDAVQYEDDDTPVAKALKSLDGEKKSVSYAQTRVIWFPEKVSPNVHAWTERRKTYAQERERVDEKQPGLQETSVEAPWRKFLDENDEETPQMGDECFDEPPVRAQELPEWKEDTEGDNGSPGSDGDSIDQNATQEEMLVKEEAEFEETEPETDEKADGTERCIGADVEVSSIETESNEESAEDTEVEETPEPEEQENLQKSEIAFEENRDNLTTEEQDELKARLIMLSEKFSQATSTEDEDNDFRKAFENLKF